MKKFTLSIVIHKNSIKSNEKRFFSQPNLDFLNISIIFA